MFAKPGDLVGAGIFGGAPQVEAGGLHKPLVTVGMEMQWSIAAPRTEADGLLPGQ